MPVCICVCYIWIYSLAKKRILVYFMLVSFFYFSRSDLGRMVCVLIVII